MASNFKRYLVLTAVLILLLMTSTNVNANQCSNLNSLQWMIGKWIDENDKTISRESWTQTSLKTYEGSGQVFSKAKNKIVSAESLRLVEMSNQIFFIAKVKHNEFPVAFKLMNCSETEAVFENQTHDFPKKLTYYKTEKNKMAVKVEGEKNSGFMVHYIHQVKN